MPGYYVDTSLVHHPWVFPCSTYDLTVKWTDGGDMTRTRRGHDPNCPNSGSCPRSQHASRWGHEPNSFSSVSCPQQDPSYPQPVPGAGTAAVTTYEGHARIPVPGLFHITRPYNLDTLSDTTMGLFSWRQSLGAAAYAMYVLRPHWQKLHLNIPIITRDTAIDLRPMYQGLFDSTGLYTMKVFALDSVMARRQGSQLDTIGEDVWALYGAQTIDQIQLYYRRLRP
jgi:hypothetical protein